MKRIYLDNAATSRVSQTALDAMTPYFTELWANPSGKYSSSTEVKKLLELSHKTVADALGCGRDEIIFTSSGSESNCLAVKGAARANAEKGRHIISSAMEHTSVMLALKELSAEGFDVTYINPEADGVINAEKIKNAVRVDTALVCVMYANNETGAIQPIREISQTAHNHNALFFTDAVQAAGALPLDVSALGADMLSLSGHKINAPKGIGALYVKKGIKIKPLINGTQENGLRGGTENAAFAAAFAAALREARENIADNKKVAALRDMLYEGIAARVPDIKLNGGAAPRLPGILNISFIGTQSEGVLHLLDTAGIEASAGSACTSGQDTPSHVLTSMNLTPAEAKSAIRFSLCRDNTEEEIKYVINTVSEIVQKLRAEI